jgi:hypothetical protein
MLREEDEHKQVHIFVCFVLSPFLSILIAVVIDYRTFTLFFLYESKHNRLFEIKVIDDGYSSFVGQNLVGETI